MDHFEVPAKQNMTKMDLIDKVVHQIGFSQKEAAEIVRLFFEIIKETLERGENIKISRFGTFELLDKKSRIGRNPQTGEKMTIAPRRVLTFKSSQVLKTKVNVQG